MTSSLAVTQAQKVRLLYKGILRLHRGLPDPMKQIGDSYVREEFRRHTKANELQAVIFMQEWTKYYVTLANQLGRDAKKRPLGQKLTSELIDDLSDDQLHQLYELYSEFKLPKSEDQKK